MARHNWRVSPSGSGISCAALAGGPSRKSLKKWRPNGANSDRGKQDLAASMVMPMSFFLPMVATRRLIVMRTIVTGRSIVMTVTTVMMAIFIPVMAPIIAIAMIAIVAVRRVMVGVGANHGARCPPDPSANHLAIAPHLVADGRAPQGAYGPAERCFILIAVVRRRSSPQGTTDGGPGQCPGLAPHLLPDNSTRHPAGGPTNCRIQILSGKRWANQDTSNNATCRTKGFDCNHGRLPVVISLIGG